MIGNNDVVPPGIHMTETPSPSAVHVHEGQCIVMYSRVSYAAAPSLHPIARNDCNIHEKIQCKGVGAEAEASLHPCIALPQGVGRNPNYCVITDEHGQHHA
jgi:hypothetical protein